MSFQVLFVSESFESTITFQMGFIIMVGVVLHDLKAYWTSFLHGGMNQVQVAHLESANIWLFTKQ